MGRKLPEKRVHINDWRREFLENATEVFSESRQEKDLRAKEKAMEEERNELMAKVGQLTIENDWLKKICTSAWLRLGD